MISDRQNTLTEFPNRVDLWLITTITLIGIALRVWQVSSLGLVQFDEGVYAISGLWTIISPNYPPFYGTQILNSPPLFFSLVGFSYWIFNGASDTAAVLVNLVIGSAIIPVVWWMTRRAFGRQAGIASAVLVALSDFHIIYSRTALTDILFGLLFLIAIISFSAMLQKMNIRWAVLSGLAVGATWNTKYHGWILLLILMIAIFIITLTRQHSKSQRVILFKHFLVTSIVAVLCYIPWALYVQSLPGGYMALMKNHSAFVSSNWFGNLWRQCELQLYMDGWLSRIAPAIAYLSLFFFESKEEIKDSKTVLIVAGLLLSSAILLGEISVLFLLGLMTIPVYFRKKSITSVLIFTSFGFLFMITPLYRPYPRLLMPWILLLYSVAGAGIAMKPFSKISNKIPGKYQLNNFAFLTLVLLVSTSILIYGHLVGFRPVPRTWMPTNNAREAVAQMKSTIPRESTVLVHGEPVVSFYLRLLDYNVIDVDYPKDLLNIINQTESTDQKIYVTTGIYAEHRAPQSRKVLEVVDNRLSLLRVFSFEPSDVRLLNDFTPSAAILFRINPTNEYDLHLYEVLAKSDKTYRIKNVKW